MTLNEKTLIKWVKSTFTLLTANQKQTILDRFGTEPESYEWTQQDIFVQIQNYLDCGEFVKSIQVNDNLPSSPAGADF